MVEDVEELGAQLRLHPLGDLRRLLHRKIGVDEFRPEDRVAPQIAEGTVGRLRKSIRVQVPGVGVPVRQNRVHAGHDIRTLVVVVVASAVVVAVHNQNRAARLRRHDEAELPSRLQPLGTKAQALDRVAGRAGKALPRVERRGTALSAQIEGILRQGSSGGELDGVTRVVEALAPGVVGKAAQAAPAARLQRGLQRVIQAACVGGQRVNGLIVGVGEVAVRVGLVHVVDARQVRALAAHVAQLGRGLLANGTLHVQVPALHVGSGEVARGHEDVIRSAADRRKHRTRAAGPGRTIKAQWQHRLRADRVRRNAGDVGVVGDDHVLRNVVVVQAVSGAHHQLGSHLPTDSDARREVRPLALPRRVDAARAHHVQQSIRPQVAELVVFLGERPEILPAQAEVGRQVARHLVFILHKQRGAVVEGGALRVARVGGGVDAAGEERVEIIGHRAIGVHIQQSALQIVVVARHRDVAELAAEPDDVFYAVDCEVVQELIGLADTSARNAVGAGPQIFQVAVEVNLRQAILSRAHVQSKRGRVHVAIGRRKAGAVAAVAKAQLVQLVGRKRAQQAERDHLHPRRRKLRKVREARAAAITGSAQRIALIAAAEGVASTQGVAVVNLVVNFDDEAVHVILVRHRNLGRAVARDGINARG